MLTGEPGVGKTTISNKFASMINAMFLLLGDVAHDGKYQARVLSISDFIGVDKPTTIAKTAALLSNSYETCAFLDEAYNLTT